MSSRATAAAQGEIDLIDSNPRERIRVIGTLQSSTLQALLDVLETDMTLDLSEVVEADVDAVELLMSLPESRCLVTAPPWLERRMKHGAVS